MCAQRLSASKDKSLQFALGTPKKVVVLNAFRHQRINHVRQCVFCFVGNDVLNAFRHQRINHLGPTRPTLLKTPGAQRLSASKDKSLIFERCKILNSSVLNAFRHQRINHWKIADLKTTPNVVLNAFRHQRINHIAEAMAKADIEECSTPFGIKG